MSNLQLENFSVTPRFLMPNSLQGTIIKIMRDLKSSAEGFSVATACEIQTPNFPTTPRLIIMSDEFAKHKRRWILQQPDGLFLRKLLLQAARIRRYGQKSRNDAAG